MSFRDSVARGCFAGAIIALSAIASSASGQPAAGAQPSAAATTVRICSGCHTMQVVTDTPKDFDTWHDTVQKMIDRGAHGAPEEFESVMDYLFANLTTIDVNHGDMDELMTVLHASQPDAQAIMTRRAAHPFKDLSELETTVPSLDKKLLDSKKRMIFFQ